MVADLGSDLSLFVPVRVEGQEAEVSEKIVELLKTAFNPGAEAAKALIEATMNALKAIDKKNGPWFRLFSRESQKATISRFQVGLVQKDPHGDVFVAMVACLIKAEKTITQVSFFKFGDVSASFEASGQKVSINRAALKDLGETIRAKVRRYQLDYLSSIADI